MKTEFMTMWDGFQTNEHARVMVLAATNRPWEVDEAILRRLPRSFEVGLPTLEQRVDILKAGGVVYSLVFHSVYSTKRLKMWSARGGSCPVRR